MYIHVVSRGEKLWQIANYYHVDIDEIIEINGLKDPDRLLVGQALLIPSEDLYYRVKQGDTMWKIAEDHGISVQELLLVNKTLNPNSIYPGKLLKIPRKTKPVIEVNGFTYFLGESAVPIVKEVGDLLTYLTPFAYLIKEDGTLQEIDDEPAIRAADSENIIPVMAINNFTYGSKGEDVAHIVLNDPETVDKLLNNIIDIMKKKGYIGLNIDFENVLPEDREAYNNFLIAAMKQLHNEGFFVSTSLAPKVRGDQPGLMYEAHDYEAHGKYADFVVLMTYEWGYRAGPPQAISPLNEMKRVLDYAVTVIPANKIMMGFQIYARDWVIPHVPGQVAETISEAEAMDRAYKYNATIHYDPVAASPFFNYVDEEGIEHEVWFEDARSAQAKFDLVKEYGLRGISYWALGYPFPQNWALLDYNFNIRKRF